MVDNYVDGVLYPGSGGTEYPLKSMVDDTLTEEGIAADAKAVGDALATKAEVDGSYDSMTVGNAEQLISSVYEEDSVPYQFRTSGGSIDIGDREEDTIIGGTVAWNQLAEEMNATNWKNENGVTSSYENGVATVSATVIGNGIFQQDAIPTFAGHKYLVRCLAKGGSGQAIRAVISSTGVAADYTISTSDKWEELVKICSNNSNANNKLYVFGRETTYTNLQLKECIVIDLTQLFGSTIADYIYTLEQTTAGAGVAWFRKLFPKPYYAYNPGELLSVSGLQSHDMVGFNAWDEEWEVGDLNTATGGNYASSDRIRSKNYIPIFPNTSYYLKCPNNMAVCFYDSDKNYISPNIVAYANSTFNTYANAHYMRFSVSPSYGTSYKGDICINLHWDGERDGEYEPYKKWSYPLDDSLTLRGIPKLDADNKLYYDGDVYESDGTVTRKYGIVDLGTLTWTTAGSGRHNTGITGAKKFSNSERANFVCEKYITVDGNGIANNDKAICMVNNSTIQINDSALNEIDATSFKTAMSGVYLVYELETPTTESADPYQNPQIVDDFGTEEYVTTSIVPVGHETKYYADLVGRIEGLPDDFSTLIAPTEKTFKATRAYSKDDFLIINNQLYKVTTSIANGGTITPNTNVRATTIGSELKQIWAYCHQLPDPPVS